TVAGAERVLGVVAEVVIPHVIDALRFGLRRPLGAAPELQVVPAACPRKVILERIPQIPVRGRKRPTIIPRRAGVVTAEQRAAAGDADTHDRHAGVFVRLVVPESWYITVWTERFQPRRVHAEGRSIPVAGVV